MSISALYAQRVKVFYMNVSVAMIVMSCLPVLSLEVDRSNVSPALAGEMYKLVFFYRVPYENKEDCKTGQ